MTTLTPINAQIAFGAQILPEQLVEIAAQGYQTIICNRPNGEDADQPTFEAITAAAKAQGIKTTYAPVAHSEFTLATITATQNALATDEKTLMYCRSGMRSSVLWAICQVKSGHAVSDVITQVSKSGHDITHLADFIEDCSKPK